MKYCVSLDTLSSVSFPLLLLLAAFLVLVLTKMFRKV
jgi:hypothetical protein